MPTKHHKALNLSHVVCSIRKQG